MDEAKRKLKRKSPTYNVRRSVFMMGGAVGLDDEEVIQIIRAACREIEANEAKTEAARAERRSQRNAKLADLRADRRVLQTRRRWSDGSGYIYRDAKTGHWVSRGYAARMIHRIGTYPTREEAMTAWADWIAVHGDKPKKGD